MRYHVIIASVINRIDVVIEHAEGPHHAALQAMEQAGFLNGVADPGGQYPNGHPTMNGHLWTMLCSMDIPYAGNAFEFDVPAFVTQLEEAP